MWIGSVTQQSLSNWEVSVVVGDVKGCRELERTSPSERDGIVVAIGVDICSALYQENHKLCTFDLVASLGYAMQQITVRNVCPLRKQASYSFHATTSDCDRQCSLIEA